MKRTWTIAAVAATLTATAVLACPAGAAGGERMHRWHERGPGAMGHFGDPERLLDHMTRILDLDETQQQTIADIITAAKPGIDDLRKRTRDNFEAMRTLDPASEDYAVRLQNIADENGRLATEATLLHGRLRADVHAELTPEQRQTLAEREREMKHRFEERSRPPEGTEDGTD